MCGFAGMINLGGLAATPAQRLTTLRAMGQQLARRGPDDEQIYDDGVLSLIFRRLSIIDVAGGRQPIWNEERTILSVVNGEIYNHRDIRQRLSGRHTFATQSDSETVVHLYEELGSGLMAELNGMFALMVWDTAARRLLLARDRLGIKPLFYAQVGSDLLFASEMKALLAHPRCPRELNWRDFDQGVTSMHANPTYIQGMRCVPGGHFLLIEKEPAAAPRPYWSLREFFPDRAATTDRSAASWVEGYGELLQDSVHKRLMSEVPVGLFLSGGIDSTLLAALAAAAQQELHCFTVVEDSTIDAGDVEQARRATAELGLHYHPVRYDAGTVLDELDYDLAQFEYLVWALERPTFSMEWLLKHELHRYAKTQVPGLKVMLLGQGADEFAGGYSRSMGRENPGWQAYLQQLAGDHAQARRADAGIPGYMDVALAEHYPPNREDADLDEYHRDMLMRTATLQSYNLWHEDRTSSSQGVESRVPFLDHRLVELLASVPTSLHADLFFDKRIIRAQLARVLPSYPPDKLKVKFYVTGRGNSIQRLRVGLIKRVFPQFCSKYLDQPGAMFSRQRMLECYQHIISNGAVSSDDVQDFFNCMAITIFDHQCHYGPSAGPPQGVNPPSPLPAWNG